MSAVADFIRGPGGLCAHCRRWTVCAMRDVLTGRGPIYLHMACAADHVVDEGMAHRMDPGYVRGAARAHGKGRPRALSRSWWLSRARWHLDLAAGRLRGQR